MNTTDTIKNRGTQANLWCVSRNGFPRRPPHNYGTIVFEGGHSVMTGMPTITRIQLVVFNCCNARSLPIHSRISNWLCRHSWELCIPPMLVTWGVRESRLFTRILNRPSLGDVDWNEPGEAPPRP